MGQRPPHPDIKQQVIIYLLLFLFYKDVAAWAKGRLMAPASFFYAQQKGLRCKIAPKAKNCSLRYVFLKQT